MQRLWRGVLCVGVLLTVVAWDRGTCLAESPRDSQRQNLAKLKADLKAIHGKSQITKQQKQAVAQELYAILSAAQRPSQESVQALAGDLTQFLADGKIGPGEAFQLTTDISSVLSAANISQESAQKLKAEVQVLLKASNLTQADVKLLQQDIQAVIQTAQQNRPGAKAPGA